MALVLPFLLLLLPSPALLSQHLQTGTRRVSRDIKSQPIKVVISDTCAQDGAKERELDLDPDSPLVLTHRIRLVPGSGSACGHCELDFSALRDRIERLEKEVSDLREKCGGAEGCCNTQQSKGAVCTTVRPTTDECPDDCSDQGRCVDGKCVCFPGFSGPDCSVPDCPNDCSSRGRCVNGQCVCDPGFTGPDCSSSMCPDNCNDRGRCVNGRCVCDAGFSAPNCGTRSCPANCNKRGRCVNGRCVCDAGFTGPDCGTRSCPDNCNNRGRCVNGKCVCDSGFAGPDCSEISCPGNCNDRGRCVNGQCVCDSGFSGPDCSVKTCPENCSNRGQCVNGKCVCESGFTGPDCSSKSCPENCSNHGRCVDGLCVCDSGFTGPECSSKTCPNDCNNKGRCVNGKCVCDVGFSGQDCSTKTCPNNCSNKGRCVRGRCVCRRGFTGPDCSECQSGFTGENCDTALMGVSHLSTRDITESSVTLFWTPPAVQYDTYHITFTSRKETDQKISSTINGRLSTYTQIGLAAGQEYTVSVTGEKDGMMGTESTAEFTTLISGPKDLQVVKTTTTSVIVQWEKVQGEIDRYVLSIAPNQTDGSSRLPEMNLPPERDSAQINGLEPGRLYDISLVAEKDSVRSLPATVQATPGNVSRMTMQIDEAGDNKEKTPKFTNTTLFMQKQGLSKGGPKSKGNAENLERTENMNRLKLGIPVRPGQKRSHGMLPKPGTQTIRRPYSSEIKHFNSSQIGAKGRIVVPSSNKSRTWYPMRPRNPNTNLTYPVSGGKPLTMKDTRSQGENTENGYRQESVKTPAHTSPSSTFQRHIAIPSATPLPFTSVTELTEEPTITTEKNITAYINGTKCVRKVLIGYRKIHGNMSNGNDLTKNLTVIVGHLNGNDLLHKLLTDRSTVNEVGDTGLEEAQPEAETFEARRSVKEQEEHEDTVGKNANVINATPFSTRQPETTLYRPLTTTSPPYRNDPHLPMPQSSAQPGRVDQRTARNQSTAERPSRKNSLQASSFSIPSQATRPKPPNLASPPIVGRQRFKSNSSSSSLETQKDKRPSWPSPITSHLAKEPLVEKEVLNSIPAAEQFQDSTQMPYRRTPFKGSYPRRPNVGPFQNSRPILESPQHPHQKPVRRPIIRNNRTTNQGAPVHQPVNVALTPAKENSTSIKIRPNVILNRTSGSANRQEASRHSQIKQSGSTRVGPNIRKYGEGNSESSFSTDHPMENNNSAQEYVLSETDGSIEHLGVNNVTSTGVVLLWGAPKGKFKQFIITQTELGTENKDKDEESEEKEKDEELERKREKEVDDERGLKATAPKTSSLSKGKRVVYELIPNVQSTKLNKNGENITSFTTVLPGTARSHHLANLTPQTRYSVSIFGKGPTFRSKTHNLVVHTGPEPPSNLAFSDVTDSSFMVSWSKPNSKVSGFKITYTHVQEGEPISVSVDSETARLALSPMTPGSTYEVRVMSVLGQDESDSIQDTVTTLPDPPTDLRAINITDSKALLLWRPALAAIDHYVIVYSSDSAPGSGITIKVSGNAAEGQLQSLQSSTQYSVSVHSQLGDLSSSRATTAFTTSSGNKADGPRDLKASQVTPRTAVLSWKPPVSAVSSYKLSYYTDGQDIKEVILDPTIKEFKLTRLYPMSTYTAQLQAEQDGLYMSAISTDFTTGNLRFPFPTDCSQEKQNGVLESGIVEVFPQGREGKPLMVYCDMETDGGGWTVFQRRKDGKTNFFKSWREYSNGFGALDGEFWLGNEQLHNFTKMSPMTLRVDLRAGDESVYARYSLFSVDNVKKHYTIRVSGYSGTAGDSLTYHNGRPFSTRDRDPQPFITRCAMSYRGGWWYKNCHEANLNGLYNTNTNHQGVIWTEWKGKDFSIPFTEMKFRPASFRP
ncbi:hypothetical protein QQF64_013523 [Cirrhinus molitorella]|uniref:Uncharacterized protein n=2 Tax=Cirrhinus molitorella TaxID=172907 RepID=A0AA88PP67_9TELE|nr:hypothetical protein Q8A67_015584 [Cirrhinus molitorella]